MPIAKVKSAATFGLDSKPIEVEVDIASGLPSFDLPIAIGILLATSQIAFDPEKFLFLGELLKSAVNQMHLSVRAYHRILKLARTIADLDEEDAIKSEHIAEAIQYRSKEEGI